MAENQQQPSVRSWRPLSLLYLSRLSLSLLSLSNLLVCVVPFKTMLMQCTFCVLSYSDTHVRMLEDCIQETILEQNKLAAGSDRSVSDDV